MSSGLVQTHANGTCHLPVSNCGTRTPLELPLRTNSEAATTTSVHCNFFDKCREVRREEEVKNSGNWRQLVLINISDDIFLDPEDSCSK